MVAKRMIDADANVTEYPWGYHEIQTDHFFCRVYKHGGGNGRPITFRAECSVKVDKRKYLIVWRHFHEWDYRDKNDAYDFAKCWIREMIKQLSVELSGILSNSGLLEVEDDERKAAD